MIVIAELVQQSELAQLLRNSLWLYPIINTGHIFGIALLIGSIIPFDLKLLGCWPSISLQTFSKILRPVTIIGILLSLIFGLLLLITRPVDYLNSALFLNKMLLIFVALINAVFLSFSNCWQQALVTNAWGTRIKAHALISLGLWVTVVFLGRLVGYR